MSCSFCAKVAVLAPLPELRVCSACTIAIGALAQRAATDGNIWQDATPLESPAPVRTAPPADEIDVDAAFEKFKEGVARQISPDDAESHLNLARAYVEMGLLVGARREAGIAIRGTAREAAIDALRLLLTPPLLRDDGIARLRAHLARRMLS